jgi:hypothetical protein
MKREVVIAEFQETINRHSLENGSNTPDWILAEYLYDCLMTFNAALQARETWWGRGPTIVLEQSSDMKEAPPGEAQLSAPSPPPSVEPSDKTGPKTDWEGRYL